MNGGTAPTDSQLLALCVFMNGMDAAGLTSQMMTLNPFCPPDVPVAATAAGELVRAITPLIVGPGNDPWTNMNFLTADLSTDGLIGNGASKYLKTGIIPSAEFPSNINDGISLYNITVTGVTTEIDFGCTTGTDFRFYLLPNYNLTQRYYSHDFASHLEVGWGVTSGTGFLSGNRTGANAMALYAGKSTMAPTFQTIGSNALASAGGQPGIEMYCHAYNNSGAPSGYSTKRISFAAVHSGLSAADAEAFYNLVQQLRISFGGGYL